MRVACIHCDKSFSLSDQNAGTHFRCPKCQKLSPVLLPRAAKPIACNAAIEQTEAAAVLGRRVRPLPRPRAERGDEVLPLPGGDSAPVQRPSRVPAERDDEVLPLAEVVPPEDDSLAPSPVWDWPDTAMPHPSIVVLGSVAPPAPAKQKSVARRKPKRQKRAGDDDRLSRFLGGLLCVFFGVAMLAFAFLFGEYLRREHGLRWGLVNWVGRVGVLTIILGLTVTLNSLKK